MSKSSGWAVIASLLLLSHCAICWWRLRRHSAYALLQITLQPKTGLPLQLKPRRLSTTPPLMSTSEVDST